MGLLSSIRSWFAPGKPPPITQPSGSDGVAAPGGYLWRGESNPSLVGWKQYLTFSNVLCDSIVVAAAARYFLNLLAGTEWDVEPNEAAGADGVKAADLVREGLYQAEMSRPWSAIVRKAALYRFYGFSAHEWIVRRRQDGLIVFADIQHRPQYTIHWWDKPDERSPLAGLVQQTRLGNRYYLPRERLFYCVDDTLTDQPDGVGLLRHVISHTERLKRYEQLEGICLETDLRGVPYMRAPFRELKDYATSRALGDGWVDQQIQFFKDFGNDHVRTSDLSVAVDSQTYTDPDGKVSAVPKWTVEMLKGTAGGPLGEVAHAIDRVNHEIARVFGCEFMLMGQTSGGGSRAMHQDKTAQFGNLIQATLGEIAGYAQNDLARTLVQLNGLDSDLCTPKLLPGAVSTEAVSEVTAALAALAQAGAVLSPGDPAIDIIRARLHLPAVEINTPEAAGMIPRSSQQADEEADGVDVPVDDLGVDTVDSEAGLSTQG